jgi:hypothetical protein
MNRYTQSWIDTPSPELIHPVMNRPVLSFPVWSMGQISDSAGENSPAGPIFFLWWRGIQKRDFHKEVIYRVFHVLILVVILLRISELEFGITGFFYFENSGYVIFFTNLVLRFDIRSKSRHSWVFPFHLWLGGDHATRNSQNGNSQKTKKKRTESCRVYIRGEYSRIRKPLIHYSIFRT